MYPADDLTPVKSINPDLISEHSNEKVEGDPNLLKYLESKDRVLDVYQNMISRDPSNPFAVDYKELDENESVAFIADLENLILGFDYEGLTMEALDLIKKATQFDYMYGDSVTNANIVQSTLSLIARKIETFEGLLRPEDLDVSAVSYELITDLRKHINVDIRRLCRQSLTHNLDIVENLAGSPDHRHVVGDIFPYVVDSNPTLSKGFIEKVSRGLVYGDKTYQASFIAELLSNEDLNVRAGAFKVFSSIMTTRYGFEPGPILDEWMNNAGNTKKKIEQSLTSNIRALDKIMEYDPQGPHILYEKFGILNFGRYPINILLKQLEQIDDVETPHNLIIYPQTDHNSAFHDDHIVMQQLFDDLGGSLNFRIVEGSNLNSLARILIPYANKYGQASLGIVGGHGDPRGLDLGPYKQGQRNGIYATDIISYLGVDDKVGQVSKVAQHSRQRFYKENATVILASCSTGKGKNPLGQKISRTGLRVICPDKDCSLSYLSGEIKDDHIKIDVAYDKGARAKMFDNGVEVDY